MSSFVLSPKELAEELKRENIEALETIDDLDLKIELKMDYLEFIRFAKKLNQRLLYFFGYPEPDDYIISGHTVDNATGKLRSLLDRIEINDDFSLLIDEAITNDYKKIDSKSASDLTGIDYSRVEILLCNEILKYNRLLDLSELQQPDYLCIAFAMDGLLWGIRQIKDIDIKQSEDSFLDILAMYENEICDQMAIIEKKRAEIRDRLLMFLLSEKEFQLATNQKLRNSYANKIWHDKKLSWIQEGFDNPYGRPTAEFYSFIEYCYKAYKDDKKNNGST